MGDEVYGFWAVAAHDPDRLLLIDATGATVTFGEMLERARALARGLLQCGLEPGDAVAAVLTNEAAFFEVLLAAFEFGWYLVPVNSHLVAPEVEHVVADSGAKVVVVSEQLAAGLEPALSAAGVRPGARVVAGRAAGYRSLDEVRSATGALPPRRPGATMMYTSGTTGAPKGVRRPLPEGDPNEVAAGVGLVTAQGFGIPPGHGVHLVCGPLYHAGPFVGASTALHLGHTLVVMPKWTPEGFLQAVERHGVTNTQMVPTMFHRLLALPDATRARHDLSTLESVFHTGAPCPVETKAALMAWWGPIVYETYGGTEAAATIATPRRWLERPGTVGRPIRGVQVHILDDDGNPCPPGVSGAIYIESDSGQAASYHKDEQKTRAARRGRLVTLGDVGYLDEDGFLFLNDRKIDLIISGGVNIYPAEVEAALLACPAVADVAVVGIPDEEWGEQVLAVVELSDALEPGADPETHLREFCEGRLAPFKRPRAYEFVEVLPRLPNGKIEKRRLRERHWPVGRAI